MRALLALQAKAPPVAVRVAMPPQRTAPVVAVAVSPPSVPMPPSVLVAPVAPVSRSPLVGTHRPHRLHFGRPAQRFSPLVAVAARTLELLPLAVLPVQVAPVASQPQPQPLAAHMAVAVAQVA
jgi:hypothetical protein